MMSLAGAEMDGELDCRPRPSVSPVHDRARRPSPVRAVESLDHVSWDPATVTDFIAVVPRPAAGPGRPGRRFPRTTGQAHVPRRQRRESADLGWCPNWSRVAPRSGPL